MAESLFVRFSGDDFEWLLFDSRGQLQSAESGDADALGDVAADFAGRVVLVVPGEDVLLTGAHVPSKQYRQILQAVPYVVEEQLATDVEDCFFALGDRDSNNEIAVAVVRRRLLESWITRLSDLGINVTTMVPENSLVAGESPKAIVDGDRVHLGWRTGRGVTVPLQELPMAVSLLPQIDQLLFLTRDASAQQMQLSELEAAELDVEVQEVPDQLSFMALCQGFSDSSINLLQGEYKVEEKRTGQQMVWRSVAILVGCAVLLHILLQFGQGWYFANKASSYETETLALYKRTFPEDRNVRDIRRRWNSHLGRRDSVDNIFISLFARSSRGLPGAGLTLDNVNFNESRGDLILQVSGRRSEELVQYTQQLTSQGLNAEIGTISQDGDEVRGSIKVRAGS